MKHQSLTTPKNGLLYKEGVKNMLIVKSMPGIIKFLFFGIIVPLTDILLKKEMRSDRARFIRKNRTYRKKRTTHFNPF